MNGARPFLLGLTGSIGMGKSTAAKMFAEQGVEIWDADAEVHRLYAKGGKAVNPVSKICPSAIIEGQVDRDALKVWISSDETALSKLEAVIHPLVSEARQHFIDNLTVDILVLDIPLLFETGADEWLDAVVVVSTDPTTQKARVLARPGMTEEHFAAILSKQMPDDEKRARADFLIISDTLEGAARSTKDILKKIRAKIHA